MQERERALVEEEDGERAEDEAGDEPLHALGYRRRVVTEDAGSHGGPPSRCYLMDSAGASPF